MVLVVELSKRVPRATVGRCCFELDYAPHAFVLKRFEVCLNEHFATTPRREGEPLTGSEAFLWRVPGVRVPACGLWRTAAERYGATTLDWDIGFLVGWLFGKCTGA